MHRNQRHTGDGDSVATEISVSDDQADMTTKKSTAVVGGEPRVPAAKTVECSRMYKAGVARSGTTDA